MGSVYDVSDRIARQWYGVGLTRPLDTRLAERLRAVIEASGSTCYRYGIFSPISSEIIAQFADLCDMLLEEEEDECCGGKE